MLQARISLFVSLLVENLMHLLFVRLLFILLRYSNACGIILAYSRDEVKHFPDFFQNREIGNPIS